MFKDRTDAGKQLGQVLASKSYANPFVLALPRGGVPVAAEVAYILNAPLDVVVVRKLGAPSFPELGFGAVAPDGIIIVDQALISQLDISAAEVERIAAQEQQELEHRLKAYRQGDAQLPDLAGKTVILVDDGVATGITALAAIEFINSHHPEFVVLAAPACATDSIKRLSEYVDEVVCLTQKLSFGSVGEYYLDFSQTSDAEVAELLSRSR
jgi:putative phosphoribosyl transferase